MSQVHVKLVTGAIKALTMHMKTPPNLVTTSHQMELLLRVVSVTKVPGTLRLLRLPARIAQPATTVVQRG